MTFFETICTGITFGEQHYFQVKCGHPADRVALTKWSVEEIMMRKIKTVYLFVCGTSVYSGLVIMRNSKYP